MNEITCKCGAPMPLNPKYRAFICVSYGEPGYDMCTPPIDEHVAAIERLGPFSKPRLPTLASAPFALPGYLWTGEFFERISSGPSRAELPLNRHRADVPWLRIVLWFGAVLVMLRLL